MRVEHIKKETEAAARNLVELHSTLGSSGEIEGAGRAANLDRIRSSSLSSLVIRFRWHYLCVSNSNETLLGPIKRPPAAAERLAVNFAARNRHRRHVDEGAH